MAVNVAEIVLDATVLQEIVDVLGVLETMQMLRAFLRTPSLEKRTSKTMSRWTLGRLRSLQAFLKRSEARPGSQYQVWANLYMYLRIGSLQLSSPITDASAATTASVHLEDVDVQSWTKRLKGRNTNPIDYPQTKWDG
jgi:hypothetical protein